MSKLYDKYEKLKSEDLECIYLFLCGNFYIALDSDAIMLNELFDMKLTKFSNLCDKCGFPKNSLEKYEEKFEKEFRNTFGLDVLDLYKIYSGRFKNKFKLTKFIEDITRVEVDENNYNELYDKCKNYLSELYPIFNKILIIDNMIDDEEIDAMLMGFNELYNDIKLEPLEDVEMSIKI